MQIFVSLAAFCEPLLEFTLDGLFGRAASPGNIQVGLVDQSFVSARRWLAAKPYAGNVRYLLIDPIDSLGVCWARNLAFSLYQGETYLLQIDSHMHFDPDWDRRLIESLTYLRSAVQRPILTTYPPPFEFDGSGQPQPSLTPAGTVYGLRKRADCALQDDCATLRFEVEHLNGAAYVEGYHIGAGFMFTLGQFIDEVPYDPFLYFHGEEQSLALRAYTRGWTILHPQHELIPLYHRYKQADESYLSHHWHPDYEARRAIKFSQLEQRSNARLLALVRGQLAGAYGLGNVRSLQEYQKISGLDYGRYLKC